MWRTASRLREILRVRFYEAGLCVGDFRAAASFGRELTEPRLYPLLPYAFRSQERQRTNEENGREGWFGCWRAEDVKGWQQARSKSYR